MTDPPTNIDQTSTNQSLRRFGWWLFVALAVLLVAICLPVVFRYQQQIALIDRIWQINGMVQTEPVGPDWLRNIVGELRMRGFDDVVMIYLDKHQVSDDLLVDLAKQTNLKELLLIDVQVADAALTQLKGLTHLEALRLTRTHVTDAGLFHLKGLTSLKELWLNHTQVTDVGLVHLKELSNLETLILDDTNVSDAGVIHLKGLTNLKTLQIRDSSLSKGGVKELQAALPKCEIFWSED